MTLSNAHESEMPGASLLSGTPSQVEWAQRIRRQVGREFDRVKASFQKVALTQSSGKRADTNVILGILEAKRSAVMSRREAGYFIRDWQEIDDQVRKLIGDDAGFRQIRQKRLNERKSEILMETKQMETIRPLYDRIVVKRSEDHEITRNGIYIPDSAKEKPQEGEVIAVGHGKRLEDGTLVALDVKVGDRILFGKYSGTETKLAGTEYIIIREDDVLGILSDAAKSVKAA